MSFLLGNYRGTMARQPFSHPMPLLLTTICAGVLSALYFAVLEGLWGASLGKRLCGLRVVGPDRTLPGVPRALLRVVIVGWLPSLPAFLYFLFAVLPHPTETGLIKFGGLSETRFIILALLFSTARRRNGFAAVQDLWTRTRIVRRPSHATRPGLEAAQEKSASPNAASQLGPYQVLETLARSGGGELLLGFDTRLLRKVWIRKLPGGSPPLAPSLRNMARVGRLRWLNGKRSSEECWDAFDATPGRPLLDLVRQRQHWSRVRFWLLDLAEEMNAGLKDQTLPATLQLDRVWITADGRAKLLDFPAPQSDSKRGPEAEAPPAAGGPSPQLFLSQVAVAALEGNSRAAETAHPESVAVPLPVHAREFLGEMQAGLSPSQMSERLRPLLPYLAVVSRGRRLALIAGCSLVPLIASVLVYVVIALTQMEAKGKPASAVVEPNLKESTLDQPAMSFNLLKHPLFLYTFTNPFLILGAIPSFVAALFRGGLVVRMLGLAVVKKDGAAASGLLLLWRSFIAWSPVLMMGPIAELVFPSAALSPWERISLNLGYTMLTASLMICAAMLPERGLQDRLAGTCLVPRD
jgi:uncharacterized RDD family membrane protein YckC